MVDDENKWYRFAVNFASSALAAGLAKTVVAPLDRAKVILQAGTHHGPNGSPNMSIYSLLKKVISNQGVSGLWRGNSLNIIKSMPSQAMIFSLHGFYLQSMVGSSKCEMSPKYYSSLSMISGALASGTIITGMYPMYFCQSIITSHVGTVKSAKFSGFYGCVSSTVKTSGSRMLYRGFTPTALSVTINRALYFSIYDYQRLEHADFNRWYSAQLASFVASLVSYPPETVGRWMALGKIRCDKSSIMKSTLDIYQQKGLKAFFGGYSASVIKSISGAIVLVVHEDISNFIYSAFK